jgi:hypothetical protein
MRDPRRALAPTAQALPPAVAIDHHPALDQDVGEESGRSLDVLEQHDVNRLAEPLPEPPLQTDQLDWVAGSVIDHQVDVGVGPSIPRRGRPEKNGQPHAGLRAQCPPQPGSHLRCIRALLT